MELSWAEAQPFKPPQEREVVGVHWEISHPWELGAGTVCLRAAGAAEEQGLKMFPPPGSVEGDPFWDQIRDQLLGEPSNETKACHQPKPILFSTGEVRTPPVCPGECRHH